MKKHSKISRIGTRNSFDVSMKWLQLATPEIQLETEKRLQMGGTVPTNNIYGRYVWLLRYRFCIFGLLIGECEIMGRRARHHNSATISAASQYTTIYIFHYSTYIHIQVLGTNQSSLSIKLLHFSDKHIVRNRLDFD